MRPTDEDQSGSRRPNLMSSTRRTASETNILAMLDRHESGGPGRRLLRRLRGRPSMGWYGAAGVLVIGLVGSLAWLARDSGQPSSVDSALAGAASSGPSVAASAPLDAPAAASAAAEVVSEADAGLADPRPAQGAAVVDVAPAEPAPLAVTMPAVRPPPPQEHAGRILPRDGGRALQYRAQHDPQRLAAVPRAERTANGKPPASAKMQAAAHPDARARRAATRDAPAAVDTDVALITAIIQHASKRQEAEEQARKP